MASRNSSAILQPQQQQHQKLKLEEKKRQTKLKNQIKFKWCHRHFELNQQFNRGAEVDAQQQQQHHNHREWAPITFTGYHIVSQPVRFYNWRQQQFFLQIV